MKKPDLKTLKEMAKETVDKATNTAKNVSEKVADKAEHAKAERSIKHNSPVYLRDIRAKGFHLPEMLHLVDNDERYKDPLFKSAIGFREDVKDVTAICVLTKKAADLFGITLLPAVDEGAYIQDPYNPRRYILVNDYFDYMRQKRIDELAEIAQKLGAKHIKISLNEEKTFSTKKTKSGQVKANARDGSKKRELASGYAEISADKTTEEKKYNQVEVLREMNFPGGDPQEPQLTIFRNQQMESLIRMRLDEENRLNDKYIVKMKFLTSADYSEKKALSINAAVKKWNLATDGAAKAMSTSAVKEAQKLEIEYQIEFPE